MEGDKMTTYYPVLGQFINSIKSEFGNEWFLFNELPKELRDIGKLNASRNSGLVTWKRSTGTNGRRLWRVTR